MRALILGRGGMGRGIKDALERRGDDVVSVVGRPGPAGVDRAEPASLGRIDVAFEFSHASSFEVNVRYVLAADCRALVVGTTGWAGEAGRREALASVLEAAGARAVVAPTFSPAAVLFGRLAEEAARLFGHLPGYDPYIFEWHRREKPDRPSGTALALADRVLPYLRAKTTAALPSGTGSPDPETLEIVALRAGANPGTHAFGFDGPGESIELRVSARDRSPYVTGALLAADWLHADPPPPAGIHTFEAILAALSHSEEEPDALVP